MKRKRVLKNTGNIFPLTKQSGVFLLLKDVLKYRKSYIAEKKAENPEQKKVSGKGSLVQWADKVNERANERGFLKGVEKKGIYKLSPIYFLKTFNKERKERELFENIDIANRYKMAKHMAHNEKKRLPLNAVIKRHFNKLDLVKIGLCVGVTIVCITPTVREIYFDIVRDDRPSSQFTTETTLPNKDVPKDEEGNIIEYPVNDEELVKAYDHLEKKILRDFKSRGINLTSIDEIVGIYENDMLHENFGDRKIIEILIKNSEDYYSLQYVKDGGCDVNTEENETRTISALNILLQESSLYSACEMDDEKREILEKIGEENNVFIGDYYEYIEQSGRISYRVPVYTEAKCVTYSISEQDLLSEEDVFVELNDYLDEKNEYFTLSEATLNKTNVKILDACDLALLYKKGIELTDSIVLEENKDLDKV